MLESRLQRSAQQAPSRSREASSRTVKDVFQEGAGWAGVSLQRCGQLLFVGASRERQGTNLIFEIAPKKDA